jgi:CRP-like cAMP-binding protein
MTSSHKLDLELSVTELKRVKVLSDLTDGQLSTFVSLLEPVQVPAGNAIVRMNELGNSMYLILKGDVQVARKTGGRETTLATLEAGDFFGEMCLFDEAPRSASVIANQHCTLLRITKQAFDSMIETHPVLAALFLRAMLRTVAGRLRTMDKRYADSMLLSRFWSKGSPPQGPASTTAARPR